MPIARFELPDGRIARFEVPEGTTADQAQKLMEGHFAEPKERTTGEETGQTVRIDCKSWNYWCSRLAINGW